jgi:hypothetical protein
MSVVAFRKLEQSKKTEVTDEVAELKKKLAKFNK